MNKEQYNLVISSQARVEKIPKTQVALASLASFIQYRNLNGLEAKLRRVHERKLKSENDTHEAEKKKDPFKKNGYKPRTFDDTLNETARRLKEKSIPCLTSLEKRLNTEIDNNITLQIYLKVQRIKAGVSYKRVGNAYEIPVSLDNVAHTENKKGYITKNDIKAYINAGVPVENVAIDKIRKRDLARHDKIGSYLRDVRIFSGIGLLDFSAQVNIHYVRLSRMENGQIPASEKLIKAYETFFGVPVPRQLKKKQDGEKGKKWKATLIQGKLNEFESSKTGEPDNLNTFLKGERLKLGKTVKDLSRVSGVPDTTLGDMESGRSYVSQKTLAVYLLLGIVAPEELLAQNQKRIEEEKKAIREKKIKTRQENRRKQTTVPEPAGESR